MVSFYALLLRTKIKPCFWNEILFIRDIKSFNGDGIFIFVLYFSKNPAYWCLSSFFSSFLESRLVGFYFEGHFISCTYIRIISLIVFVVAFPFTFPFTELDGLYDTTYIFGKSVPVSFYASYKRHYKKTKK